MLPLRPASAHTMPAGEQLRLALANRPYFVLLLAYVLVLAGNGAMAAAAPYFCVHVLGGKPETVGLVFGCLLLAAIAAMPLWVQSGGLEAWIERLKDPATRARVKAEMMDENADWENLAKRAGNPENVLLLGFKNPALKPLTGKTLGEVSRMRGTSPEDTAIDLVIEDGSRVGTAYFLMDEANVKRQTALPWMSFGSDAGAPSAEGVFLLSQDHPRAYGNVARLLGKYVREEKTTTLQDAVRRLSHLPVTNMGIKERGLLKPGYFADVVVFDPATITDHATFAKPAQYATGVSTVFVNGVQVLKDGEPTGAAAGRFVKGPGVGKCPA
jgi:N-acyl-D-amino-acid deacylase